MTHDVVGEASTGLIEAAPCLLGDWARPVRELSKSRQETQSKEGAMGDEGAEEEAQPAGSMGQHLP